MTMSIIKKDRSDLKLVGAYVPPPIHHYLSLYVMGTGSKKSDILDTLLESWIVSSKDDYSEEYLIDSIVKKLSKAKEASPEIIAAELINKGISEDHTFLILQKLYPNGENTNNKRTAKYTSKKEN